MEDVASNFFLWESFSFYKDCVFFSFDTFRNWGNFLLSFVIFLLAVLECEFSCNLWLVNNVLC